MVVVGLFDWLLDACRGGRLGDPSMSNDLVVVCVYVCFGCLSDVSCLRQSGCVPVLRWRLGGRAAGVRINVLSVC